MVRSETRRTAGAGGLPPSFTSAEASVGGPEGARRSCATGGQVLFAAFEIWGPPRPAWRPPGVGLSLQVLAAVAAPGFTLDPWPGGAQAGLPAFT